MRVTRRIEPTRGNQQRADGGGRRGALRSGLPLTMAALLVATLAPPAQAATPSLDPPVLNLAFEGTTTDAADPANPVTVNGTGLSYIPGVASGTQALRLAGNTSLDLGASTALQPENLTLSFWVNPTATLTGEQVITWNKGAYNTDGFYLSSESDTSPLVLSVGPGGNQPYKVRVSAADRNAFLPTGQWTHIVVTYDRATKAVSFYRNGAQVPSRVEFPASGASTGVLGSSPTLPKTIGFNGPQYNGAYLNAGLDEYRVYNDVATLEDVVGLYEESGRTIDRQAVAAADAAGIALPAQALVGLVLPTSGSGGSRITWTTSDADTIGVDGTVTRPAEGESDVTVTLTASVSFLGGPIVTKPFTVSVPAATDADPLRDSGLTSVMLSDDYLNNAATKEHEYLLELSSEKFLFEFYKVAGLTPTTTEGYGGWERSDAVNFRGHAMGHYMSALAMSYASTTDPTVKQGLLDEITAAVKGLTKIQDAYAAAHPSSAGYVSAFRESALDAVQGTGTTDDNVIVPWYNLHKVLAGLIEISAQVPGAVGDQALAIASQFGEYTYRRVIALQNTSALLSVEYGGMNDSLYDLFARTGNAHFKRAAEAFDETTLFRQLAAGQDVLNGKHANTTIPKLLGALKRYNTFTQNPQYYALLTEQEKADLPMYLQAAQNFFQIVVDHHTYVTGANSQAEHFHEADKLYEWAGTKGARASAETTETCNEYNMLKLSRELFKITKDVKYANFYENTFINTILSSQNPDTGMTTYFQAMAPGFDKIYSLPFTEFWCCTGTGMENFSKLGGSIYFTGSSSVWVNMFFSSTFSLAEKNLKLRQVADLPNDDTVAFTVDAIDGGAVAAGTSLRLRVPDWIAGSPTVTRNGSAVTPQLTGGYLVLRDLVKGDRIEYTMPMKVTVQGTPDNPNFVAFKYGPVVLSTSLGTKNIGASEPTGILVRIATLDTGAQQIITAKGSVDAWKAGIENNLVRIADNADGQVQFQLRNTLDSDNLVYTPHFERHGERYGLYMNLEQPDSAAAQARIKLGKELLRSSEIAIDSLTSFDGNNFENEKKLKSANSTIGVWQGRQYRDARAGGYFSYELAVDPSVAKNYLSSTYYGGDNGRTFDVFVNDVKLKTVVVSNAAGNNVFYDDVTELPASALQITDQTRYKTDSAGQPVLDAAGKKIPVVVVRYQSTGGLVGGLFGVQINRTASFGTASALTALSSDVGTLAPAFAPATTSYTLTVPRGTTAVDLDANPQVPSGLVRIDGILFDDTQPRTVPLPADGSAKTITLTSFAQNHTASTAYTVRIEQGAADTTKPVATLAADPATPNGSNGWWTAPVTMTAGATDDADVDPALEVDAGAGWVAYGAPVTLADGIHTVSARATDDAGNVSDPASVTVKVDATVPTVTGTVADRTVTATAADSGAGVATVEYRWGSGAWTTYTAPVAAPDDAAHTASLRATDAAGNVSAVGSVSVPAAADRASVTLLSNGQLSADGWYNQAVLVTLGVPTGKTAQYRINDGAWVNYRNAFTVSANRSNAVVTRLLAAKVVVAGTEATTTVKVDTKAPVSVLSRNPSGGTGSPRNPVTLTWTASDAAAGVARTEYQINGTGTWSAVTGPLVIDTVGTHLVGYRSVDKAGNTETVRTSTVTIAANAPTTVKSSATRVAAGGFVTLTVGGYERFDLLAVKLGETAWATVGSDVNGQARTTLKVPAGTPAGKYTVTVSGSDGSPTASMVLTVSG